MKLTSTLVILLGLLATGFGYVLDRSCQPYADMLVKGMSSALDLAQAGHNALPIEADPGTGAARAAQRNLVDYLFSETIRGGYIDFTKLQTIRNKFYLVLRHNRRNGRPSATPSDYRSLTENKVVIFCDYSRYRENQDCQGNAVHGRACDSSLGINVPMDWGYEICKSNQRQPRAPLAMVTSPGVSSPSRRPARIEICAWYLKETQQKKIQTLQDFQSRGIAFSLARSVSRIRGWLRSEARTPIDVLRLFDAALLHELTHTLPDGQNTVDLGRLKQAYGWDNAVYWSQRRRGSENAENYMLFALGSKLISPNPGVRAQLVMYDGSIQVLDTRPFPKRDLHGAHYDASLGTRASDTTCFMDHDENDSKSISVSRNAACKRSPSRGPSSSDGSNSSVSLNASSTTGKTDVDNFTAWDFSDPSWNDLQQSILLEALADDTDPYIVWSPPNQSTTVNATQMLSGS